MSRTCNIVSSWFLILPYLPFPKTISAQWNTISFKNWTWQAATDFRDYIRYTPTPFNFMQLLRIVMIKFRDI